MVLTNREFTVNKTLTKCPSGPTSDLWQFERPNWTRAEHDAADRYPERIMTVMDTAMD